MKKIGKFGMKKPKVKPTQIGRAFDMPKGPKGPQPMRKTPAPPPFGRIKAPRGTSSGPAF
jgi:hypothetical protein